MNCPLSIPFESLGQGLFGTVDIGAASRANRVSGMEVLTWLLIIGGIITAVCVTIRVVTRLHHKWRFESQTSLFLGLCRLHGLDFRSRRLLRQVARSHRLSHPVRLFTEPDWLDPAQLPSSLRQRAAEASSLHKRLFT